MEGAREYSKLFTTGQIGRLYIVSGSHARGRTFHIFVIPDSSIAKGNGPNNPPIGPDIVEVYGVTGGQLGWTEKYGWLHRGKWEADFLKLVEAAKEEKERSHKAASRSSAQKRVEAETRVSSLLDRY